LTAGTPHQALYRRWRAQTFSEIVGQEAVVTTLRNAVLTGRVAHAILFTGPRGTGKTSLARILAKAVNCLDLRANGDPCDRCDHCVAIREGTTLDVSEIDAASNRGIEDIKGLRAGMAYAPSQLRRKVYILDEAHQITKDGWNALLKSLEEPPDFVVFMFASTHPQDFPPAILSRVQRFDVRRLTVAEITGKLDRILAADGREADAEAVRLIARLAAGGMRDAESILDQLLSSSGGPVEAEAVRDLLGLADGETVRAFLVALVGGDAASGIGALDALEDRGRDLRVFLDQAVDTLRERMLEDVAANRPVEPAVVAVARRLASIDPTRLGSGGLRLQLELALLEPPGAPSPVAIAASASSAPVALPAAPAASSSRGASRPRPDADTPAGVHRRAVANPPDAPAAAIPGPSPAAPAAEPAADPSRSKPREPRSSTVETAAAAASAGDDLERLRHGWVEVVAIIGASPVIRPLIIECRPIAVEANMVTLGFPEEKTFLKEALERRRAQLEGGLGTFLGHPVGVRCVATNLELLPPLPSDVDETRILEEANRIFGDDLVDVPEVT
jgi:DNA polymerase-3 subunit gamma/tau